MCQNPFDFSWSDRAGYIGLTAGQAIAATKQHWKELATATEEELKAGYGSGQVHVGAGDCALCVNFKCVCCPYMLTHKSACYASHTTYTTAKLLWDDTFLTLSGSTPVFSELHEALVACYETILEIPDEEDT
tara:strand:- start:127 stop:522 length:396 start_codon:yes stop_codon:yes gene_type:complete